MNGVNRAYRCISFGLGIAAAAAGVGNRLGYRLTGAAQAALHCGITRDGRRKRLCSAGALRQGCRLCKIR